MLGEISAEGRSAASSGPVPDAKNRVLDLELASLHGSLTDPMMSSLKFLNEVSSRFPESISFAAGRPTEDHFDTADITRYVEIFTNYLRAHHGMSDAEVRSTLLQYGRTNGIIHELVARQLEVDEGVRVPAESVVVTVGAQEGMFLVLRALCAGPRDAVLSVSPTYAGLAGAARLVGCPVVPVRSGSTGIDLADLRFRIEQTRRDGLRPRALYVIPDAANPTGISLDTATRHRLLEIAEAEDLLLLEDNAYSVFAGPGDRLPSLKALDERRRVIRIGSFAKTVWPGARVGYVLADQLVGAADDAARTTLLADQLGVIKSMLTVNTSPVTQALVGGALLANGSSLFTANERQNAIYQRNLGLVLDGLRIRLSNVPGVSWNSPSGGFFVTLSVPFHVDAASVEESARTHGVLWTPMSAFYTDGGGTNEIRLAFSQMHPETIEEGLDRLAGFIRAATSGDH
ncbi:PLP-dependent aminotransferase family protein [Streptomyces sp. NPDC050504]|uniref:PLP-dependent aminotransferase family protein n=1 Tax=Streptomyces sp. NPDC050504 TaxID=3365618 RepID=UPI0037BBEBA6